MLLFSFNIQVVITDLAKILGREVSRFGGSSTKRSPDKTLTTMFQLDDASVCCEVMWDWCRDASRTDGIFGPHTTIITIIILL